MKIADFVVELLVQHNVRRVYGYPGAAILGLMDAIHKNKNIEWILMRNENAASLAASAEAKLTGYMTVCMSSSGPGVTNLITGLLDAHTDQAPVLAITGMVPTAKQNIYGFQDISNADFFKPFLYFSKECENVNMLASLLLMAISHVQMNLQCAHIAIPADIALQECPSELAENLHRFIYTRKSLLCPPKEAFMLVKDYLETKSNPIIVVGKRAAFAGEAIEKLAEKIGAPILATADAKGIIRDNHPNFLGVYGMYGGLGQHILHHVLKQSSLVISFGVNNINTFILDKMGCQKRSLLLCESSDSYIKNYLTDAKGLYGPLDQIAVNLTEVLSPHTFQYTNERKQLLSMKMIVYEHEKEENFIHPKVFLSCLNKNLKSTDIITTDIGDNHLWALQELELNAHQRILGSETSGVMGFGLVAGIAAKLTKPDHRVITIAGDGGISMYLAELATAVQYKCNIIIVVLNNGVLQRVAAQQNVAQGVILHNPDFVTLMKSYGGDGITIRSEDNIDEALQLSFQPRETPFLINVITSPSLFVKVNMKE